MAIIDSIKEQFHSLSVGVGPIGNLYTVFMHDLAIHFTGILMHRESIEHYRDLVEFPLVNKSYALSPYKSEAHKNNTMTWLHRAKVGIRQMPLSRVAMGWGIPFGTSQDWFAAKTINMLGSYKPFVRAYLPRRSEQIDNLLDFISNLCKLYEIVNMDTVVQNWRAYVELHTIDKQVSLREHSILVGTRNNLQNRKLSVNYLQQGKRVVAVTHGEVANSVMDEPPFGYSERTLCTTLVDYGNFDLDGQYNKPLITPRNRLYRNAPLAKSVHRLCDDIVRPNRRKNKALYIPTSYAGNGLYGPFHVYEDTLYRRWQQALFQCIPNLTLKVHPKSRGEPLRGIPTDCRSIENCIYEYDLLILDYFATGSMLALVTDKPVIYFDIGLRHLHPEFLHDLIARCEYSKIDWTDDLNNQINVTLTRFWSSTVSQTNTVMVRYAFCEEKSFNWFDFFFSLLRADPR